MATKSSVRKVRAPGTRSAKAVARPEARRRAERARPPILIGGVNSQEEGASAQGEVTSTVGVHWLTGTIPSEKADELTTYLTALIGAAPTRLDRGIDFYDRSLVWDAVGVRVLWDSTPERARMMKHDDRIAVSMPGGFLDTLTARQLVKLCHDLCYKFWLLASRVDVNWDDFERRICPQELYDAYKRGDVVGYKVCEPRTPGRIVGREHVLTGDSVEFGRRGSNGSGRMIRIYDKQLESGGSRDCIRWEVQYSGERARHVMWELARCSSVEALGASCGALVGGAIDFLDRQSKPREKNLSRIDRLEWWARIIELLGQTVIRNSQPTGSVERTKAWIHKSVSASVAMIKVAIGGEGFVKWLHEMVTEGEVRMTSRHRAYLAQYFKETGEPIPQKLTRGGYR